MGLANGDGAWGLTSGPVRAVNSSIVSAESSGRSPGQCVIPDCHARRAERIMTSRAVSGLVHCQRGSIAWRRAVSATVGRRLAIGVPATALRAAVIIRLTLYVTASSLRGGWSRFMVSILLGWGR